MAVTDNSTPAQAEGQQLSDVDLRRPRSKWPWFALAVLAVCGAFYVRKRRTVHVLAPYAMRRVDRGDIAEMIEANGTVQPVLQVQVGSQISGRIVRVHANFNQRVRENELLAELDPLPYQTALAQSRATLESAQASLARARSDVELQNRILQRAVDLRARGFGTPADLDIAQHAATAAQQQVRIAGAEVARASIAPRRCDTVRRPTLHGGARPPQDRVPLAAHVAPRGMPRAGGASIGCAPQHCPLCGKRSTRCA